MSALCGGEAPAHPPAPPRPSLPPSHHVRSPGPLAELVARLRGAGRVALDTEADSLYHYREKVCVFQLSFSGENYVVDPLAGLDLVELVRVLEEKPLIIHGADYDLRLMRASFGFRPRREVCDTMLAAQLLGVRHRAQGGEHAHALVPPVEQVQGRNRHHAHLSRQETR